MDDFQPLRIAILSSEAAPHGLDRLLADPNRGVTFEILTVARAESDIYDADYVFLDGYHPIVTEELLARFPSRVLAIHDADLSLRDVDDMRFYASSNAVRDAILSGEPETRATVYIVTREVCRGPLFLLGRPHPVAPMALDARDRGDADFLTRYAELHRRWMHATSFGELLARTIELLAGGTMQIIGNVVWIDGAPGPCRAGEAPRACHEPAVGIPRSCPFIA